MKVLRLLLVALVCGVSAVSYAKDDKDDKKKSKREIAEEAKKKADDDAKKADRNKVITYTALVSKGTGTAAEADIAELKTELAVGTEFTCKDVVLEEGKLKATLTIKTGRITKSDVTKLCKEKGYRVDKLSLEEEKDDKKDDKKAPKKDDKKPA